MTTARGQKPAPGIDLLARVSLNVGHCHHFGELMEIYRWSPTELGASLVGTSEQQIHFGGAASCVSFSSEWRSRLVGFTNSASGADFGTTASRSSSRFGVSDVTITDHRHAGRIAAGHRR
jgi:hypothetical protein